MKVLTSKDIKMLKRFCVFTPAELTNFFRIVCLKLGYKEEDMHYKKDCYFYIKGDDKYPTLVAHIDTVRVRNLGNYDEFFYDSEERVLWCPELAGFDDRAGVYAIYKLITETDYRPSIILFDREEIGGKGAVQFCSDFKREEIKTKYFIEMDRQGYCESVYYLCDNPAFENFINYFGFSTAKGIFSDVYLLGPVYDTASVNLSIGYLDEHTLAERLYLDWFEETFIKVKKMLEAAEATPYFKHQ